MKTIIADGEFCKMVDEKTAVTKDGEIYKLIKGILVLKNYKPTMYGYIVCEVNGKQERLSRVILTAFSGPCPEGLECCHNDGDRTNNHIDNLRWDTHKNNSLDKLEHNTSTRIRVIKDEHNFQILTVEQIKTIVKKLEECKESMDAIANEFRVSRPTISAINQGRNWRHLTENMIDNFPIRKKGKTKTITKLTEEDAKYIRELYKQGVKQYELAEKFSISRTLVYQIIKNLAWK